MEFFANIVRSCRMKRMIEDGGAAPVTPLAGSQIGGQPPLFLEIKLG